MGVNRRNIQVIRDDHGKLYNNFSYGTYLEVAIMVYKLK